MNAIAEHPSQLPERAEQLLPRPAYIDPEWLVDEQRKLFAHAWTYACTSSELSRPGDFVAVTAGQYPLFVVRTERGKLAAFHNLCRHRGTELLEGQGQLDKGRIVCPYHRWTYTFDGNLAGMPMKKQCFGSHDTSGVSLFAASVGEFKGLVFVNPEPGSSFDSWIGSLQDVVWPHELEHMSRGPTLTYEMHCNWKVFYENAIDGYHLAYLHDQTLGGPRADLNVWDTHDQHLLWYSTETGTRTCMTEAVRRSGERHGKAIKGAESEAYAGVYMLFPGTIVTASPVSFSLSTLTPVTPDCCHLTVRTWEAVDGTWKWLRGDEPIESYPGYDPASGMFKLEKLEVHPLETGDFHWEDVWICEKIQRSLHSPRFEVGELADGVGAESPLTFFQRQILDAIASS